MKPSVWDHVGEFEFVITHLFTIINLGIGIGMLGKKMGEKSMALQCVYVFVR